MGWEDFVVLFSFTRTQACIHKVRTRHIIIPTLCITCQDVLWTSIWKVIHTHNICKQVWMHIQSNIHTQKINTLTQTVVSLSRMVIQKVLSSITFNYSWQPLALIYTKHVQTSCYTLPPRKGDRRGRQAACLPAEKAFSVHDMDMGFGDPAGARLRLLPRWRLCGRHVASAAMGLGMSVGLGPALCSPGLSRELPHI